MAHHLEIQADYQIFVCQEACKRPKGCGLTVLAGAVYCKIFSLVNHLFDCIQLWLNIDHIVIIWFAVAIDIEESAHFLHHTSLNSYEIRFNTIM